MDNATMPMGIAATAMQRSNTMAMSTDVVEHVSLALVCMRGTIWCKLHVGTDVQHTVDALSAQLPIDVYVAFALHDIYPDAALRMAEAIQSEFAPSQKGWFQAVPADVLAALAILCSKQEERGGTSQPVVANDTDSTCFPDTEDEQQHPASGTVDAAIWDYVVPCGPRDASKAVQIRDVLVGALGKKRAAEILAATTATVSQDADGCKNRVRKVGNNFLKLRDV